MNSFRNQAPLTRKSNGILLFVFISIIVNSNAQNYSLNWADQLKGTLGAAGVGNRLIIGNGGNIISAGRFQGTIDFDPGPGTAFLSSAGFGGYITKMNSSGNLIWAKHFANLNLTQTPGNGDIAAIREDVAGNIYCVGNFGTIIDFDPGPASYTMNPSIGKIFVSKLDALGNLIWVKQIAGDSTCAASDLRIDTGGDLIVVGNFSGPTNDFDPGPGVQNLSSPGTTDGFVCKLSANGNFIWVKQFGGIGQMACHVAQFDASGNICIGGIFTQSCDIDPGPSVLTYTASNGASYFCKLDAQGNYLGSWQFGHASTGIVSDIAFDSAGNIYLDGSSGNNADFDPSPAVFSLPSNGTYSGFIAKYTSSGGFLWAKGFNTTSASQCNFLQIDNLNNVFAGGPYGGTIDLDPGAGIYQYTAPSVYNDAFIVKLDVNGNFLVGRQLTGSGGENIFSGQLDGTGSLLLTGVCNTGSDLDPSANSFTITALDKDPYILKLSPCLIPSAPVVSSPTQAACVSGVFTLTASGTNPISWTSGVPGNIYVGSGTQYITPALSPTVQSFYAVTTNTCAESFPPTQITVTVHAAPIIGLSASNPTFCLWEPVVITATGGINYVLQNSFFSNTISIVPLTTAIYTVSGGDQYGCSNTATIQLVRNDCVSIAEQEKNISGVVVFPNPSSNMMTVRCNTLQTVEVFDIQGRLLLSNKEVGANEILIDVSSYSAGLYLLKVRTNDGTAETIRVVRSN